MNFFTSFLVTTFFVNFFTNVSYEKCKRLHEYLFIWTYVHVTSYTCENFTKCRGNFSRPKIVGGDHLANAFKLATANSGHDTQWNLLHEHLFICSCNCLHEYLFIWAYVPVTSYMNTCSYIHVTSYMNSCSYVQLLTYEYLLICSYVHVSAYMNSCSYVQLFM